MSPILKAGFQTPDGCLRPRTEEGRRCTGRGVTDRCARDQVTGGELFDRIINKERYNELEAAHCFSQVLLCSTRALARGLEPVGCHKVVMDASSVGCHKIVMGASS